MGLELYLYAGGAIVALVVLWRIYRAIKQSGINEAENRHLKQQQEMRGKEDEAIKNARDARHDSAIDGSDVSLDKYNRDK